MTSYQSNQEAIATEETTETTTINYVEIIENVIDSLEQDDSAMVSHTAEGGTLWKFKYGSAEVFVQLAGKSDEDTLTVWSVVLKLPAKDEPKLMRQLLEMNCSSTFEARFGIIENQVVVIAIRTLGELSPSEVSRIITVVASIADSNDDALQSEFGAT